MVLWSFKIKICFHWWAVARWCHVAAPHHHVDQVGLGQHDDNVAFVYLLRLHPLLSHLLRAKLNESKPSWGTYPTMVAELISGKVWIERWQKIWSNSNFLATHSCGRSTSTWLSTAFSPSSPGGDFDLDKLHFTVLPGLVPCTLWKEKVARQLVALCLVSSLGHNTCVFFSDQPDIPCCQAVAGDVVLNLRRHGNK